MVNASRRERRVARRARTIRVFLVMAMLVGTLVAGAAGGGLRGEPAGAVGGADSLGTDFWLAFPGNAGPGSTLTLFITGPTATTGTVAAPGAPGGAFSAPFTVTPGVVSSVEVPTGLNIETSDTVEDLGIHVTAAAEVTVYGLNRYPATTDAYLGLPTDILGTEYIAQGYKNVDVLNGTQFAVVGTQSATTVTITPAVTTDGHTAGTPYTVTLGQGQTYQLRNTDAAPADLSGTVVTANKPVAVFGGHACANIPAGAFACDHIVEEMTPTTTWGKAFVTEPLATRTGGDTFRYLASTANTTVKVNGTTVATLNRGELFEQILTAASVVTSDKPILVTQYSNSSTFDGVTSDPFEAIVPPAEQFLNNYTVTTPASGFATNFINVVAPTASIGTVKLDGVTVSASSFTAIPGSTFSGAQLPVGLGSHTVTGGQPIGITVYGFDSFDSYGYPGGLSLAPVATVTSVALAPQTGSNAVNTQHCVTATVLDQSSAPVVGVRVDFTVTGVNPTTGFANTAADGTAQFCYTGTNQGTDTIKAAVGTLNDTATELWTQGPPTPRTLTVSKAGTGSGSVSSSPAGITCGATCSAQFPSATVVTLTESPAAGSTFAGWSGGGCSGTATTCQVTLTADTTVTAMFNTTVSTGLTVTGTSTPTEITAGNAGLIHFTISNGSESRIRNVKAVVTLPTGATPFSIASSTGTCSKFSGGVATCSLGDISPGGTRGVDVGASSGSTGPLLVSINVTGSGGAQASTSAGPTVVAKTQGTATGFVFPGRAISIGDNPTAANPTVATFSLPNSGTGAPIVLRAEPATSDPLCGGQPCRGNTIFLSPFTGYTDTRHPPILKIVYDVTTGVRRDSTVYIQDVEGGPSVPVANCRVTNVHLADPHPCVHDRTKRSNGDIEFEILLISGDPRFRAR